MRCKHSSTGVPNRTESSDNPAASRCTPRTGARRTVAVPTLTVCPMLVFGRTECSQQPNCLCFLVTPLHARTVIAENSTSGIECNRQNATPSPQSPRLRRHTIAHTTYALGDWGPHHSREASKCNSEGSVPTQHLHPRHNLVEAQSLILQRVHGLRSCKRFRERIQRP